MSRQRANALLLKLQQRVDRYNGEVEVAGIPWDNNATAGIDFLGKGFHHLRESLMIEVGSDNMEKRLNEQLKREAAVAVQFAAKLQTIMWSAMPVLKYLAKNGRNPPRKRAK